MSSEADATTLAPAAAAPDAPLTSSASGVSETVISVSWAKPAEHNAPVTGYKLQYRLFAGAADAWADAAAVSGGDTLTTEIDGLIASTKYTVRICAVNSVGASGWSSEADATTLTPALKAPNAPEVATTLGMSPSVIDVTWTPPAPISGVKITSHELQFRQAGDSAWSKNVAVPGCAKLDFKFAKLKSSTEYEWRVCAVSEGGVSAFSSIGKATTLKSVKEKLHEVKVELDIELGDSCPDVDIDVEQMKIVLSDEINFKGGKAVIQKDDLPVQAQLEKTIVALYTILQCKGYDMFHIRFDGHVHPTGKDMRCLVISYFRAAELVRRVVKAGCPKEFLHAYGYGQRMPITSDKKKADLNRRVEINFLDHHHIEQMDSDARELWAEIEVTGDFDKFVAEPASFGHEYVKHDYAPHGV